MEENGKTGKNEDLAWDGVRGLHRSGVWDVYHGEEMYDTDQPIS